MFEQLHWLPLSACIQLKILILIFRPNAFLPINLRCLCPHITRLIDITFWFPVLELQCQSLDRLHQLVPLFAMRCFLLLFCYTLLSGSFFFLKPCFFCQHLAHCKCFSVILPTWSTLCLNTIHLTYLSMFGWV